MEHKRTKRFKCLAFWFTIASVLCTILPAMVFTVEGLLLSELAVQKTALVCAVFVSIVGSLYCLISKKFTFRSKIWIFLLAIHFSLNNIERVIIVFAITQIADELILAPLARHFRSKYSINKEIDER